MPYGYTFPGDLNYADTYEPGTLTLPEPLIVSCVLSGMNWFWQYRRPSR